MEYVVIIIAVLVIIWFCKKSTIVESMYPKIINQNRTVTLHYTNWCSACKMIKPIWIDVKQNLSGKGIVFIEHDEELSPTPDISGYPTIRCLDRNGRTYEYPGNFDFESLRSWIVSPIMV